MNPGHMAGFPYPGSIPIRSSELVRAKGLEPPHLAILVPKTSASTNSATPAEAVGRVHKAARNAAHARAGRAGL